MKYGLYITASLLFIMALAACNGQKEAVVSEASEELDSAVQNTDSTLVIIGEEAEEIEEPVKDNKPFLTYSRTYCFGMCPVFKSSVSQDGVVEYEGINFVDNMGDYTAQLTEEQMNSIREKLMEVNYFELDSVYDNEYVMDLPAVITSASIDGKSNSVLDRYDGPKEIKPLYSFLDELFKQVDWVSKLENE